MYAERSTHDAVCMMQDVYNNVRKLLDNVCIL